MRRYRTGPVAVGVAMALIVGACSGGASPPASTTPSQPAGTSAASGGPSAAAGPFKISFSNYIEAAPLFHSMRVQLDKVLASKTTGVEIKWYDNKGDPQVMLENVGLICAEPQDFPEALVERGIRAIPARGVLHHDDRE